MLTATKESVMTSTDILGQARSDGARLPAYQDAAIVRGLIQSPLPVAVFDADLRIAWANKAAEKLSRCGTVKRWRGRRFGEVFPGPEAGLVERSLCSVLETGQPVTDL